MNELQDCILGDLVEFQRGYDLPKDSFVKGEYPVQSSNGILGYHNEYKVKAPGITIGRSGTVGIPHLITKNFFPHNTALYVKDFKGNNVHYIYYLLKNLKLNEYKTGSGVPTMNRNHLHPLKIKAFTDSKYQKSIAAVLSALDKKIALNKQINARLEEMAKTLYDYWFVQFDFPDANGKPYKSSGGEMVFDETLKREIPKGWEVKSLGEIENNIITGKTPSTQYSNFFNGDIPFITIGDIRNNTFIIKTEQNLSIEGANNQKNKYLPEGSLCVSCIATVGLIGFTTRQAQTNQQINSIIFKHDYNKEFLYFYLKDYFLVGKAKTGNTFANMNKGDFEKILVLYPNLKLLQKYSNKMVLVFNQINNLSKQNHQLTQLRDFLLPMLMNGQVSVAE
jgi:restriction modification system DNA specificity subunit